jgi:hypothetical protein
LAGTGSTNEGLLYPSSETATLYTLNGKREVAFSSLDRVIFLRWKGKNSGVGGEWRFEPSDIEVYLKDGTRLYCTAAIPELSQPVFQDRRKATRIYSIFFEYRGNGIWSGSKQKSVDYPNTHPAKGCAVFIDFI